MLRIRELNVHMQTELCEETCLVVGYPTPSFCCIKRKDVILNERLAFIKIRLSFIKFCVFFLFPFALRV